MLSGKGNEVCISDGDSAAIVEPTGAWIRKLVLNREEILKESTDGKATHGGACSLIPFAGRVRNATYSVDDELYTLPRNDGNNSIHGFTRNALFSFVPGNSTGDAAFHAIAANIGYPSSLDVTITMHIESARFTAGYAVKNAGAKRAPLVIGCHPYFLCKRPWKLFHEEHLERLVMTDTYFPDGTTKTADFNTVQDMGSTAFDDCFRGGGMLTIRDDETEIRLKRNNMDYFLLYNGRYCENASVAIEPMTGAPDAFNNGIGLRMLDPGETFGCSFEIELRKR